MRDYYKLLGLPLSADAEQIKAKYRALSKTHHPDMGGSEDLMSQLNEAYTTLSDTNSRAVYDKVWRRAHTPVRKPDPRQQPVAYQPVQPKPDIFQPEYQAAPAPAEPQKPSWFRRFVIGTTMLALLGIGGAYATNALVAQQAGTAATPTQGKPTAALPSAPTSVSINAPAPDTSSPRVVSVEQKQSTAPSTPQSQPTDQTQPSTGQNSGSTNPCQPLKDRRHLAYALCQELYANAD